MHMIFQASIDLEVADENVHAVIDFDTGLIGFTERKGDQDVEYSFMDGPLPYRLALLEKLRDTFSAESYLNHKISRKSEVAQILRDHFLTKEE